MFADSCRPRTALRRFGITQSRRVRYGPVLFVSLVVAGGIAGMLAVEKYCPWGNRIKGTDALTAVLALGAFIIGYHQWRSARHETSLERYYDRLKLANDARNCLSDEDHRIAPMHMYVYIELDNLEYVLQKFRLGYMAPDHALRGVNTFNSRIEGVRGFADTLESFGDIVSLAGYQQETSALLRRLLLARSSARAT